MISLSPLSMPDRDAARVLLRRLAAMFYDTLLLIALLFAASLPLAMLNGGAIPGGTSGYQLYLLAIIFVYLGWHWTHGGQTLGMKSWRLQAVTLSGQTLTWEQALLRFVVAMLSTVALGLGYLWLLIDGERLTWHDRLSGTKLVNVQRES